jgi:hypothetical protein
MVHNHKVKGFTLFGTVALAVTGLALTATAAPIPKDTVFSTYADNNASDPTAPQVVMLTKDSDPTGFAFVDPNPGGDRAWLAPIGFGPDGHLYLAIASQNGTLLDLTSGGDRSKAGPIAKGIFADLPHKISGMAFDAEGNVYLSMSEADDSSLSGNLYPISRVALKTGTVSHLKGTVDHAKGLAIRPDANKNEILYIVEGNTGKVLTYNLTTDTPGDKPLATGFPAILDHGSGQIAFDPRGKLFVSWQMDPTDVTTGAVFDITNGGDFSDFTKTPPVLMMNDFKTDVNGMAFDSKNNLYMGGDNHFTFVSPFDATKGTFGDFVQYANDNGGGDSESVAIAP